MIQRFINGEGIHFASLVVTAGVNEILQVVAGNLDGKRISDDSPGALVVFHPCWMRNRDPDRLAIYEKFYVHCIRVSHGNGNNERLVQAMEFVSTPTVGDVKVLVHPE